MARPVKWLSLILSLLFIVVSLKGQAQLIPGKDRAIEPSIIAFSMDRTGNIFLALEGGTIRKLSPELDSLLSYNPTRVGDFELLEAWHGFQVFAFNRKFQDFVLQDRFLSRESRYNLGQTGLFYIDLATLSSDQNLWLLEQNDLRLMKYNFRSREVILDIGLAPWLDDIDHKFSFIREYQNLLFLVDKGSGTHVFDNLGNYIKKIDTAGAVYLSFDGEYLYYLSAGQLVQQSLYAENISAIELPPASYKGVVVFKDKVYLLSERKIEEYLFNKN